MWDIGGQESLRSSWNTYFADSDFVIFVVDSTDRERLPISKMEERFYIDRNGLELIFWPTLIQNLSMIGESFGYFLYFRIKYKNVKSYKKCWHMKIYQKFGY